MSYISFTIPHANVFSQPSSSAPKRADSTRNTEMYGSKPPLEEPDNVILHEPWDMPPNAGPNHCAPGGSILIQSEEDIEESYAGRGRRFSLLGGKRRPRRASSVSSSGKSKSEGKFGGLFESNPFSFDSDPPRCAADIKVAKPEPSADGRSSPASSLKARESALKFGALPHRPPEMKRANSISIGVLSRKNMLQEQNGGGQRIPQQPIVDTEPEPVDLGVVMKSGAKHLWRNVRSTISSSSSSSSQTPSSPAQSSISDSSSQNAYSPISPAARIPPSPIPSPNHSNPSISDSVPPPAPSEEFAKPMGSFGLQAVTEETGSGAATPIAGKGGSSLGLEHLHLKLENVGTHTPRLTSTNLARVDSGDRYREWSRSPNSSPGIESKGPPIIKHPDPARQNPSPPPQASNGVIEEEDETSDEDIHVGDGSPGRRRGSAMRPRSASHGANDYAERADRVVAGRAEREEKGETREAAIQGYQR